MISIIKKNNNTLNIENIQNMLINLFDNMMINSVNNQFLINCLTNITNLESKDKKKQKRLTIDSDSDIEISDSESKTNTKGEEKKKYILKKNLKINLETYLKIQRRIKKK